MKKIFLPIIICCFLLVNIDIYSCVFNLHSNKTNVNKNEIFTIHFTIKFTHSKRRCDYQYGFDKIKVKTKNLKILSKSKPIKISDNQYKIKYRVKCLKKKRAVFKVYRLCSKKRSYDKIVFNK